MQKNKKALELAHQEKNEKQKESKIRKINQNTEQLKHTFMRFEQTHANALKNQENIQTDTDFQKQLERKLDETNKTNEKYAKDMETIKTGLKTIVTVTTNTQSKINEIESKLERMNDTGSRDQV